jgi:hypothetical protein
MKLVSVSTITGKHATFEGEPDFDPIHNTLTVGCPHGTRITFNWDVVEYFVVSDPEEDHVH